MGVFSGTATSMPSFCWPFGLGPNAAMIRPRTGQRKPGVASTAAFAAVLVLGVSTVGVTMLALSAGAVAATTLLPGSLSGAAACSPSGLAAPTRAPGMTIRSPMLILLKGRILLALAISATDVP